MGTRRELLLIADIGGYTDYMQFHRSVLGHAEAATRRMLDKIVDAVPGFRLVEIEGDAAFLARDVEGLRGPAVWGTVTTAATAMHRAFHAERRHIELNLCPCGSCTATNGLTLKFVAHVGEVATQTIRRRTKLVGLDVIHVHRLLKNPVTLPEYLLVTDELCADAGAAVDGLPLEALTLDLEGIGSTEAHVVALGALPPLPDLPDPTWPRRIVSTFAMVGRGLPHVLPRRQPQTLTATG